MLFLFGCALALFLLLLVFVGGVMFWRLRSTQRQPTRMGLAADWRSRLRVAARVPPALLRLAPPRSESGNAAMLLYPLRPSLVGSGAITRLVRGMSLGPEDTAAIRRAAADTTLDVALRAARMTSYHSVPLMLADTARLSRFARRVDVPNFFPSRGSDALKGLVLRGHDRMARGRRQEGERDLRAAIGLGLMMAEREPTAWGAQRGLQVIANAATVLALALPRRDSLRAGELRAVAAWADSAEGGLINTAFRITSERDSVLAALVDTTLPFPFRAQMLHDGMMFSAFSSPWRAFRGPSNAVWRSVRAYEQHPDPDFAAIAVTTDSVLTAFGRIGRFQRLRLMMRSR